MLRGWYPEVENLAWPSIPGWGTVDLMKITKQSAASKIKVFSCTGVHN